MRACPASARATVRGVGRVPRERRPGRRRAKGRRVASPWHGQGSGKLLPVTRPRRCCESTAPRHGSRLRSGPFNISQIRVTFRRNRLFRRFTIYHYRIYACAHRLFSGKQFRVVKCFSSLEGPPRESCTRDNNNNTHVRDVWRKWCLENCKTKIVREKKKTKIG